MTSDSAAATQFYTGLLGIASSKMESPIDYTMLNVGGTDLAGVMQITENGAHTTRLEGVLRRRRC
jgi:predicted enzyme related to lactoylglutathione lyase